MLQEEIALAKLSAEQLIEFLPSIGRCGFR